MLQLLVLIQGHNLFVWFLILLVVFIIGFPFGYYWFVDNFSAFIYLQKINKHARPQSNFLKIALAPHDILLDLIRQLQNNQN